MKRQSDMSRAAYTAALRRNGFSPSAVGVEISDSVTVGAILSLRRDGEYHLDRRATLARAIRESRKHKPKREITDAQVKAYIAALKARDEAEGIE